MDAKKSLQACIATIALAQCSTAHATKPLSTPENVEKLRHEFNQLVKNYNTEHDALVVTNQRLEQVEKRLQDKEASTEAQVTTTGAASDPPATQANGSTTPSDQNTAATDPPTTPADANAVATNEAASQTTQNSTILAANDAQPAKDLQPPNNSQPTKDPQPVNDSQPANDLQPAKDPQPVNDPTPADNQPIASNNDTSSQNPAEVKKRPDAQRGIEAFLQDQNVVLTPKLTIEAGLTYTNYDRRQLTLDGFLALDSIFLGDISVDNVRANTLTFDLSARYSLTDRLQIGIDLPWVYRSTSFVKQGVGGVANATAETRLISQPRMGDALADLFYQVYEESPSFPGVILNFEVKMPTGVKPYGIPTRDISPDNQTVFIVPTDLPTGDGMWSLTSGLTFTRTVDPAVIFGGLAWKHNFIRHFSNVTSDTTLQPGYVKLGDVLSYNLGIAFALNDRTSISLSFSQQIGRKDQIKLEGADWISQQNTESKSASLNTGFTYGLTENLAMVAMCEVGLNDDAPDVVASIKLPYTFS